MFNSASISVESNKKSNFDILGLLYHLPSLVSPAMTPFVSRCLLVLVRRAKTLSDGYYYLKHTTLHTGTDNMYVSCSITSPLPAVCVGAPNDILCELMFLYLHLNETHGFISPASLSDVWWGSALILINIMFIKSLAVECLWDGDGVFLNIFFFSEK